MKQLQQFMSIIMSIIIGGAVVVAIYVAHGATDRFLDLKKTELTQRAIETCMTATTATWKDTNNTTIVEPFKSAYEQCLKDKEIQ